MRYAYIFHLFLLALTAFCNIGRWIIVGLLGNLLQAQVLASYKPYVNATTLIPELKQVKNMAAKALGYFNSTRHILLYYEDVVKNRAVSPILPKGFFGSTFVFETQHSNSLCLFLTEFIRSSRLSKGPKNEFNK